MKNLRITEKFKDIAENKLKLNKTKIAGIGLAIALGVGCIGGTEIHTHTQDGNIVGHTDICAIVNDADNDDFVILNVGSYKDLIIDKKIDQTKLDYLNSHNISTGLIIETESDTEGEMLKEVVYVKQIMEKNKISLPVYINIDNIINNNDLDNQRNKDLITSFLSKCSANNMYVGIFGTDENLKLVKEYLDITEYDALVKTENGTVTYDGTYYYYIKNNKIILSNPEINPETIIENKNLNNKTNFINDATAVYEGPESLEKIAMASGLSVNDILYYNNVAHIPSIAQDLNIYSFPLIGRTLEIGDTLYIPSENDKELFNTDTTKKEYVTAESPLKGADISDYNTVSDWDKIGEEFDFLILKAGEGETPASKFSEFAKNASLNNIPIGLYLVNTVDSNYSQDEIKKKVEAEAALAIKQANYKNVDYPVYLDLETARTENISNEDLNLILETWYEKISEAGFIPGIYSSGYTSAKVKESISEELYENYSKWFAYGENYSTPTDINDITPQEGSGIYAWSNEDVVLQQASEVGQNSAGGTGSGYIDVDFSKINYSQKVTEEDKTIEKIQLDSIYPKDMELMGLVLFSGIIGVKIRNKIKNKSKQKTMR